LAYEPFGSEFCDHFLHFTRAGEAAVGQFGIDQIIVDCDLKAAAIGGQEGEGIETGFKFLQEVDCQTGSLIGIRSNRAVLNRDLHGFFILLEILSKL
jgi:hypothetical protein